MEAENRTDPPVLFLIYGRLNNRKGTPLVRKDRRVLVKAALEIERLYSEVSDLRSRLGDWYPRRVE